MHGVEKSFSSLGHNRLGDDLSRPLQTLDDERQPKPTTSDQGDDLKAIDQRRMILVLRPMFESESESYLS